MNFIFWLFKFGWLVLVILLGNVFSAGLGFLVIPICIAAFLLGNSLINKLISPKRS
ncbi:hypothetical protein [Neobacillus muris]|uniref:hypothetical protein n=1 Tax=Neobacillus muris TaxID=2941334 RepID=UPI00203DD7FA|nr:hypothetical protein [Neobacillus muris]